MNTIPTCSFYGNSLKGYIPPALRQDTRKLNHQGPSKAKCFHFPTQSAALEAAAKLPGLELFSEDLDSSGTRHYLLASYNDFWEIYRKRTNKHFYEVIRENVSCKLYFDLEYVQACNTHIQESLLLESIAKLVKEGLKQILKRKDYALLPYLRCLVLDSSSKEKFSKHIVFPKIVFPNNRIAGKFISTLLQCSDITSQLLVLKPSRDEMQTVLAIDLSVYSRNRCFRILGSSKFGENRPLTLGQQMTQRLLNETLVCCFHPDDVILIDEAQIGYIQPLNDSFELSSILKTSLLHTKHNDPFVASHSKSSPFPQVDKFIESVIGDGQVKGSIRNVVFFSSSLKLVYNIQKYRYCHRIGRHHKSNHIVIIVELNTMCYYQKCLDPECRAIDYRSPPRPLPEQLLQDFNLATSCKDSK
ncbi:hypothetical protein GpartN1_g4412.t1 [Galdieria partita]|uniref:DNA-directed primase/polymerase protein n=1 Tax=Galdieria partita TaxID=83374 RepID=A0A9C7PXX4_9RHOD|nr:hypothetical protein GpartN1_g4412.t1 [Galdieria partita]